MAEDKKRGGGLLDAAQRHMSALLGALLLSTATLFARAYGDTVLDAAQRTIGTKTLAIMIGILASSWLWLLFELLKNRLRRSPLDRLRPVRGKGYSADPRTGAAACPSCTAEGRLVFMLERGDKLYCYACNKAVLK